RHTRFSRDWSSDVCSSDLIYSSGFKDFDETYVLGDLRHLQRLNQWESNEAGHFEVFVTDYSKLNQTFNQVYQNTPSLLNVVTVEIGRASCRERVETSEHTG